jgi:hypothetical protein
MGTPHIFIDEVVADAPQCLFNAGDGSDENSQPDLTRSENSLIVPRSGDGPGRQQIQGESRQTAGKDLGAPAVPVCSS